MKNLFNKIICTVASALFLGLLTGCNPEPEMKQFSVTFKGYGPGYVSVQVTQPNATTVAYVVAENPIPNMDATMLNMMGTQTTFYSEGEQQLLDYPVEANTRYYVYLVGLLGENFSKVYEYEFETGEFVFDQLATVIGVAPDGYKMHIKVPESVKTTRHGEPGSRAIRYTQGDLMIYNFYKSGNDDYFNLLYNAGRYVREDTVIEYADDLNWGEAGMDVNEDGVIDADDLAMQWNPIAPGEPVVFVAGEFEWMSEPDEYKKGGEKYDDEIGYRVNGFPFPGGWDDGYYVPCLDGERYWAYKGFDLNGQPLVPEDDSDAATKGAGIVTNVNVASEIDELWTGAFQKKVFRTRIPAKLDGDFEVSVEDLRSVDATIRITPTENIYRYLFTVLDDGAYNQMLELLDGKTEYLQWAVTSYFTMYNFGQMQVVAEAGTTSAPPAEFSLSEYFYDVPADTKYHVLITGMSGKIGSPQCFKHHVFSTPAKTKTRGPNIVVTALPDKCTAYSAAFNVKCTTVANNKAVRCYYGANYKSEWVYDINSGGSNTYEILGQTTQFTQDELDEINSEKGYNMFIPTIDGETTRLVVVAFNDENISNGIDQYEDVLEHPAVEDCTTPYAVAENISYNPLLDGDELVDDWTLTATVKGGAVMKEKVSIKRRFVAGKDYPTTLPDDVLKTYQDVTEWTDDEIYGYFEEFKTLSTKYNTGRLRNQNKLLIEGWLNDTQGSLDYLSPWDLFRHETINMVDVPSMFARFGPKIYLHVNKAKGSEHYAEGADSLSVTANNMYVSPVAQWSVPFYMAGIQTNGQMVFSHTNAAGGFGGALEFPVTLSEDHNTITIGALQENSATWYPNVVGEGTGIGGSINYILENQIISDVVLTRGWTEPEAGTDESGDEQAPATRASFGKVALKRVDNAELVKYTPMSDFKSVRMPVRIEGEVTTLEKVHENFEKFRKEQAKRFGK